MYWGPSGPPAPLPSKFALRAVGADFHDVARRRERDGAIEGGAAISGIWHEDRIEITNQRPADGEPDEDDRPSWKTPPCPAPTQGWPSPTGNLVDTLDFDIGDLKESGAAVNVVTFRPELGRAVLVVAATDIPAVEAHLRPQLGPLLCIVANRYTRAQIDSVHHHLHGVAGKSWTVHPGRPQ